MKQDKRRKISLISLSILMIFAAACTQTEAGSQNQFGQAEGGREKPSRPGTGSRTALQSTTTLTNAEIEGLQYMREEEKLAGDVYRFLYETWGSQIFQNIAASEDMHTQAVLDVLNTYGIADPASPEAGQFNHQDLQALYDELAAIGSQSLEDALTVGTAIEEIDILDLEARLAETENADIRRVYENLLRGSENHLRAFVRVLENQTGITASPTYLPLDRYQAVIEGRNGMGGGRGNRGAGNGRGQGRN